MSHVWAESAATRPRTRLRSRLEQRSHSHSHTHAPPSPVGFTRSGPLNPDERQELERYRAVAIRLANDPDPELPVELRTPLPVPAALRRMDEAKAAGANRQVEPAPVCPCCGRGPAANSVASLKLGP